MATPDIQINGDNTEQIQENAAIDNSVDKKQTEETQPSNSADTDVLYSLTLTEDGKDRRTFYKDTPWKGISVGLPGFDTDEFEKRKGVLVLNVEATVKDKTGKKPNTPQTWRDEPVDFEFGRDAILEERDSIQLELFSERLTKTIELLLDYYPGQEKFDVYWAYDDILKDTFVEIMYCFAQLKAYLNSYRQSLPHEQQADPRYDIGNCGDEKIADWLRQHLDFGQLDMTKSPCDEATAYDIAILLRLLAPMYRAKVVPTWSSMVLDPRPLINYTTLWLLFKPGTYVYAQQSVFYLSGTSQVKRRNQDDEYSAWVISSWRYDDKEFNYSRDDLDLMFDRFELTLWNVQHNGVAFQRTAYKLRILRFEGYKSVLDLKVVPASVYDKSDAGLLRHKLEARGQKTLSILQELVSHREYTDPRHGYQGQIIVDAGAYRQYSRDEDDDNMEADVFSLLDNGGIRFGDIDKATTNPPTNDSFSLLQGYRTLLQSRIGGFALKTKRWMMFDIDYITDKAPLPFPNQLDTQLVLASDADRESLRTILPKGERPTAVSPDFVAGKGEGKIFLLYGPPGTGKTLTVECVANDTRRPLLSLTAQDLGLYTDMESRLRTYFTLAAKWDAILLLDEADLFLEQRKAGDVTRNNLSIIFLRTMEYYNGVLFLTTNRPGHIDDSFISRITCPIKYDALTDEAKRKIVEKFVKKFEQTGTILVNEQAKRYLEKNCQDLNGRQIRNVLQNAVASAETSLRSNRRHKAIHGCGNDQDEEEPVLVEMHHVKAVVERQNGFREYLDDLRGKDEAARAMGKRDYLPVPPGSPRY